MCAFLWQYVIHLVAHPAETVVKSARAPYAPCDQAQKGQCINDYPNVFLVDVGFARGCILG